MSLKDRLNLNNSKFSKQKEMNKEYSDIFNTLISSSENILIAVPLDIQIGTAMNFIGTKLPEVQRLVAIGDNLTFQKTELLKFEPDTKNMAKDLINTALNLKASKIMLQEFIGQEAIDIFKLINSGIDNTIIGIKANNPINALNQMELNLYLSGLNIPIELIRKNISKFISKIVILAQYNDNCIIDKIFELKSIKNNEYIVEDILKPASTSNKIKEIKGFDINTINVEQTSALPKKLKNKVTKNNDRPQNLLARKLKQNK